LATVRNLAIETWTTCRFGSCIATSGQRKLFHDHMNWTSASVTSAGRLFGRTTCQKIWNSEAPSTVAASSRSRGISMKAWRIRNTPNGLTSDGRMTAAGVSVSPAPENSR